MLDSIGVQLLRGMILVCDCAVVDTSLKVHLAVGVVNKGLSPVDAEDDATIDLSMADDASATASIDDICCTNRGTFSGVGSSAGSVWRFLAGS